MDVISEESSYDLNSKERWDFLIKVSMLVLALLVATILQSIPVMIIAEFQDKLRQFWMIIFAPITIYAISMVLSIIYPKVQRTVSYNIILMVVVVEALTMIIMFFTAAFGDIAFIVGFCCSPFTCVLLGVLSYYFKIHPKNPRWVVTILMFITLCYMMPALILAFFISLRAVAIVTLFICFCTFSAYFYYQCQELLHGNYSTKKIAKYIYTALILYMDFMAFVLIFMSLTSLRNLKDRQKESSV